MEFSEGRLSALCVLFRDRSVLTVPTPRPTLRGSVGRLPNSQVTIMGHTKWVSLPAATVLFVGVALGSLGAVPTDAIPTQPAPAALVRVDQVGYLPSDAKHAYLMASYRVKHATWDVIDGANHVVARGFVGTTNRGPWNTNYPDVYDITFSGLGALGTYHLRVHGDASAQSP